MKKITAFTIALLGLGTLLRALEPAYESEPIRYSEAEANNRVTRIQERIESGEDLLSGSTDQEVLLKLLKLLEIPVDSQVLVYSKTSAQNSLISPKRPRAIYFSDNAYVGWVQYGDLEIAIFDPKLGMVFYRGYLQRARQQNLPVTFKRDRSCLSCHGGSQTRNWPGLLVRSVYPREDGHPILHAGTFRTDHSSPLEERWGGWYVTGESGGQEHLGNILATENKDSGTMTYQPISSKPIENLDAFFSTSAYPAGGVSDIAALMILEHQLLVHNALIEGLLVTRQTLYRHRSMRKAFGEPVDAPLSETNQRIIDAQADRIVRAMLFADEFEMTDTGIEGSATFQKAFSANARKSTDNRSLKDLRLYERLFKYRCSYLIYSDAFQNLPPLLKSTVLTRMKEALRPNQSSVDFGYLSQSEKERINAILEETYPDWPES